MMQSDRPLRGCLWPMWPHGTTPTHEYCGCERRLGSSYCANHLRMSIRDFEEEPRQTFVPRKHAA